MQVELSDGERREAVESWRSGMAPLYERRTGPRKVALEAALAPWSHWRSDVARTGVRPGAQPISAQQRRSRSAACQR